MARFRSAAIVALTVGTACQSPPNAPLLRTLRDQARLVLETHCGSCHLPGLTTSLAGALAVYDLSTVEWAASMSERQMRDAEARLASGLAPGGQDGTPIVVSSEEQAIVKAYFDGELARRH